MWYGSKIKELTHIVSKSIIYHFKLHFFGSRIIKLLCSPTSVRDTSPLIEGK